MDKLFEIKYAKKLEGEVHWGQSRLYQIPATNEQNALVKLGQIFHQEDTQIDVLSIKQVR